MLLWGVFFYLGEITVESLTKDSLVTLSPAMGSVEALFELFLEGVVLDVVVLPWFVGGIFEVVTKLHCVCCCECVCEWSREEERMRKLEAQSERYMLEWGVGR